MARTLLLLACALMRDTARAFLTPPAVAVLPQPGPPFSPAGRRGVGGPLAVRMQAENEILRFRASDMQVLRKIGDMGYATITDWEYPDDRNPLDTGQPRQTVDETEAAVRLWEARVARGPLRNARYILKEYLPIARDVGEQELRVYTDLLDTFPPGAYFEDAPVATLRGWFQTSPEVESPEFRSQWEERLPDVPAPRAGNLWLAFRWEYFKPMSGLALSTSTSNKTFWDKLNWPALVAFGGREGAAKKEAYLRHLVKECLSALVFLHERGVVHRSLGSSSVGLPFYIEAGEDATNLRVKLRDLGFAARIARLDDETLQQARAAGATTPTLITNFLATEDIYAMGYALAETIFNTLALKDTGDDGPATTDSSPPPATDQMKLKALMEDIYDGDISGAFRDYCAAEPRWDAAVEFLDKDDKAGWELLEAMVLCRRQQREARKPGRGKGPKPLSEMSDSEASQIQVPVCFVPTANHLVPDTFVPRFESDINKVPSARGLLDNALLRGLQRPWYAEGGGRAAAPGRTLLL